MLVDEFGMKLLSLSGVVLGTKLDSSASSIALPLICVVIDGADGFDETVCDFVGSNVGSEDGVADGSFVIVTL